MSPISNFQERTHSDTIVLFDVDGTLTPARQVGYLIHLRHYIAQGSSRCILDGVPGYARHAIQLASKSGDWLCRRLRFEQAIRTAWA